MYKNLSPVVIFLLGYIFIFQQGSAQTSLSIGVKGGISVPDLQGSGDNPVSKGWSTRLGPYTGIIAELQISDKFSLQSELNYSSQGGKKNGTLAIPTAQFLDYFGIDTSVAIPYIYTNGKSEAKLNYIELPVLLKINFPLSELFTFFINAGPYAGYLINAKNKTEGSSNIYFDENLTQPILPGPVSLDQTVNLKDDLNKLNFGIQGGLGLSYHLSTRSNLFLTGGGNYGLVHIQKDKANGSNNTGAATLVLGYLIKL
ncbi:MAG TPA: porin family protein [Chitinophagaceae bacterium]